MPLFSAMRDFNQSRNSLKGISHVGTIIENKHPDQNGYVQVRIKQVHDGVDDADLPWVPAGTQKPNNTGKGVGTFGAVPNKGAEVYINFESNDPYHPVYKGAVQRNKTKLPPFQGQGSGDDAGGSGSDGNEDKPQEDEDYEDNYPYVYGEKDRSGNISATDTTKDTSSFRHVSGTSHAVDGYGNVAISIANKKVGEKAEKKHDDGFTMGSQKQISVGSNGDITISSGGNLKLIGSTVSIHSQGDFTVECGAVIYLKAQKLILPPIVLGPIPVGVGVPGSPDSHQNIKEPTAGKRPEETTGLQSNEYESA